MFWFSSPTLYGAGEPFLTRTSGSDVSRSEPPSRKTYRERELGGLCEVWPSEPCKTFGNSFSRRYPLLTTCINNDLSSCHVTTCAIPMSMGMFKRRAKRVGNAMSLGQRGRGSSPGALALTMLTWGPQEEPKRGRALRGSRLDVHTELPIVCVQRSRLDIHTELPIVCVRGSPSGPPKKVHSPSLLLKILVDFLCPQKRN